MAVAYIAIGANLGDPLAQVQSALQHIDRMPETAVTATSSWYRSEAIGPAQPDYLNAVTRISTSLDPVALLDALQQIEHTHGRQRNIHWGPRTLDLDLLLYDRIVLHTDRLTLPHPQLALRNFVLIPLLEIAPDLLLPDGSSVAGLAAQANHDGLAAWQQNQ